MTIENRIIEEAAGWLTRQQRDDMDWGAFTAWLEADPRNRQAYDEVALIDARLDACREALLEEGETSSPEPANDREPVRWGRLAGWGGGALIGGLALLLAIQPASHELPVRDYRSPQGKSVEVALGDGTRIVLAPASHLAVQGDQLALEGIGYFDVPHQPGRSLTIRAGDFQVTDIGTRFSLENEPEGVSVEVAEGSLSVASEMLPKAIALTTGHGMAADKASGTVRLTRVQPQQVAIWRTGKIQFDQVPLALVVRDISRYSGEKVTVDPAIAGNTFSGVIAIDDGASSARALAQILSLNAKSVDGGVRLEPRS
jgi:transmembrane sensor